MSRPVIPPGQRTVMVRDPFSGRASTWGRARCRCGAEVSAVLGMPGEPVCDPCFETDQRALCAELGVAFNAELHS